MYHFRSVTLIPPHQSPRELRSSPGVTDGIFTGRLAFLNKESPCEALVEVVDPNSGKLCKVIIALATGQPSRYPTWSNAIRSYFGRAPYPASRLADEDDYEEKENDKMENKIKAPKVVPTLAQLGSGLGFTSSFLSSYSSSRPSVGGTINGSSPAPASASNSTTNTNTAAEERPALARTTSISCINEFPSRMSDFDLFHFAKGADKDSDDSDEEDEDDEEEDENDSDSDEESGPMALFRPMKSKTRSPLEDRQTQDVAQPSTPRTVKDKGKGKVNVDQKEKGKEKENDGNGDGKNDDTPLPSPSMVPRHLNWFTSYELVIRTKSEKKYNL